MLRFLRADLRRLTQSRALLLYALGMLLLAAALMVMQATAMDYTVPLSRVVFLPLSFYGVASAAFVSAFAGTDFSDGFIRNKLIAAARRRDVVFSQLVTCCAACALVFAVTTLFTLGVGSFFFQNDVTAGTFAAHFLLGIGMSLSVACLFAVVTLLCGNKPRAIVWCMGIAFAMLFLSLHTNQALVQPEIKDGLPNPHYISGLRRAVYGVLHDLNPCGQAAQLSTWRTFDPLRMALCDLLWVLGVPAVGCILFDRKDIQ